MTKKMIDADAFCELLEWISANEEHICDFVDFDGVYINTYSLVDKINELATILPTTHQ